MTNNDRSARLIDLNQADEQTLATLPGIGPKLATRIVRFRQEVHPFEEAIEVTAVAGVSERMYRQFADKVTASIPGAHVPSQTSAADLAPAVETHDAKDPDHVSLTDEINEAEPQIDQTAGKKRKKKMAEYYIISTDEEEVAQLGPEATMDDKALQPRPGAVPAPRTEAVVAIRAREAATNFLRPWLLMVVGALVGATLALALLYSINDGTLTIASHPAVVGLEQEASALKARDTTLNGELSALREQVNLNAGLSGRLQRAEAEVQVLKQARDAQAEQLASLQEAASGLATQAADLEDRAATLAEQVASLEQNDLQLQEVVNVLQTDTARFNTFLGGLIELLQLVQEPPAQQ
jgi:hypothetical protein